MAVSLLSSVSDIALLALNVVETTFGTNAMEVVRAVMNTEECTLLAIRMSMMRRVKYINCNEIREIVTLLMHHNIIRVELPPENDDIIEFESYEDALKSYGLLYTVNTDAIINRIRIPHLAQRSRELYGHIGEYIIEELAVMSRVGSAHIRANVLKSVRQSGLTTIMAILSGNSSNANELPQEVELETLTDDRLENIIQSTLELMIQRRLVVVMPKLAVHRREKAIDPKMAAVNQTLSRQNSASLKRSLSQSSGQGAVNASSSSSDAAAKKRRADAKAATAAANKEREVEYDLPIELRMTMEDVNNSNNSGVLKSLPTVPSTTSETSLGGGSTSSARGGRGGRGRGRGAAARTTNTSTSNSTSNGTTTATGGLLTSSSISTLDDEKIMYDSLTTSSENQNTSTTMKSTNSNETLWTIGWDQYFREERHALCVSMTKDRLETLAAEIVKIILDNSIRSEVSANACQSTSMSLDKIIAKLEASNNKPAVLSHGIIKKLLDVMQNDAVPFIGKIPGSDKDSEGPSYFVNMSQIVTYVKRKAVHAIACRKFDIYTARIVELLQKHDNLEQQQVGDLSIMPLKDAIAKLYTLYRFKWVDYLELSKRNDFVPSQTYYFWKLDHEKLDASIKSDLFKTMHNLRVRFTMEMKNREHDLAMAEADQVQDCEVYAIRDRLNQAMVNADKTLLLFTKF